MSLWGKIANAWANWMFNHEGDWFLGLLAIMCALVVIGIMAELLR